MLIALEADPASTGAGVALFALFSHLLEIPFGAVGLTLWLVTRPRHTPTTTHTITLSDASLEHDAKRPEPHP